MFPYFLRNLLPRPERRQSARSLGDALASLTATQCLLFFSGWLAWTCDAIDFFSVTLSITNLAKQFNREPHVITTAITLTLLFRTVGAIIFGVLSDRIGRKWPLVANLLLVCVLQIGAGFVKTLSQFLALRALFGVAMGGIWGLASSTALENLPVEARGLASGILQQGYAVGYLIAAVINLTLVPETKQSWRSLFWTAGAISFFAATMRAILPESAYFLKAKETNSGVTSRDRTTIFLKELRAMLRNHWLLCIYAVLLMTGFNFLSHGSQDLYPTYMQKSKGFSPHSATIATIIGNCGAVAGGVIAGWASQYIGRRLTIVLCVLSVGAFIPLWILPTKFSPLAAGAFCLQFGVQGAWGIIPIQLAELSPPAFRATFPGVAYQLGNMVSSASAQIEATAGDRWTTTIIRNGKPTVVPDYAKVQGIFIGVVATFVVIVTIIGPENHGSQFEKGKTAYEEGAGNINHLAEEPKPTEKLESHEQLNLDGHEKSSVRGDV